MATMFYARYIPPPSSIPVAPPDNTPQKRKRTHDEPAKKKSRKTAKEADTAVKPETASAISTSEWDEAFSDSASHARVEEQVATRDEAADSTEAETSEARQNDARATAKLERKRGKREKKEKKKHQKEKETKSEEEEEVPVGKDKSNKHSKVLSKLAKSAERAHELAELHQEEQKEKPEEIQEDAVVAHGLEPLPQPAPVSETLEKPSYATLEAWLREPFFIPETREPFSGLGVAPKIASALEKGGYNDAFPIQAAVLYLLRPGTRKHNGDICISAATGSGKTLAYALPVVSSIAPSPISRLRGLVIVPTRELVRQAREAFELCASGSGLKIGTAIGTVPLKDEQSAMLATSQVYDPVESKRRTTDWTDFNLMQYVADCRAYPERLPGHTMSRSPNVDILVCTPGRLVDHIRSTKGFTLEHLEWLVIDEADRLLNESFQEWVDVVIPALDRRNHTTGAASNFLAKLGHSPQRPPLRKIILSATLTRDIQKLNSLRLANPKLVVVGPPSTDDINAGSRAQQFSLPPSLRELQVPVLDDADKPLYLLTLLYHIQAIGPDDPEVNRPTILVFTRSSEGALRLSRLLTILCPALVDRTATLTKSTTARATRAILTAFRQPDIEPNGGSDSRPGDRSMREIKPSRIIIATDRAARGLDLPRLSDVISYDVPGSATEHVHRAGRTARAGRPGRSWCLTVSREMRWFAREITGDKADDNEGLWTIRRERPVERIKIKVGEAMPEEEKRGLKGRYSNALAELGAEVASQR